MTTMTTVCCESRPNGDPVCSTSAGVCPATASGAIQVAVPVDRSDVVATATMTAQVGVDRTLVTPGACVVVPGNAPTQWYSSCLYIQFASPAGAPVKVVRAAQLFVGPDADGNAVPVFQALACPDGVLGDCAVLGVEGGGAYGPFPAPFVFGSVVQPFPSPALGDAGAIGLGAAIVGVAAWKLRGLPARARAV